jgi:hypothetical protein
MKEKNKLVCVWLTTIQLYKKNAQSDIKVLINHKSPFSECKHCRILKAICNTKIKTRAQRKALIDF